jgi:membrane dipeptidase
VPDALKDAAHDWAIVEELARRGYDDDAIAKICRDNWLRVLKAVWV